MSHTTEIIEKQPSEVIDIEFDFSRFFRGIDDQLASAVVSISGNDSILQSGGGGHNSFEFFGTPLHAARLWLQAGTDGEQYLVEAQFTSDDGRVKEVDFYVRIRD